MPPPDSSGIDVGGPLRLRPIILPTTTPTTRPTTSSPPASPYSTYGVAGAIATDVDDAPTATVCVPSPITEVKVTVFVSLAANATTLQVTLVPSTECQTRAMSATSCVSGVVTV